MPHSVHVMQQRSSGVGAGGPSQIRLPARPPRPAGARQRLPWRRCGRGGRWPPPASAQTPAGCGWGRGRPSSRADTDARGRGVVGRGAAAGARHLPPAPHQRAWYQPAPTSASDASITTLLPASTRKLRSSSMRLSAAGRSSCISRWEWPSAAARACAHAVHAERCRPLTVLAHTHACRHDGKQEHHGSQAIAAAAGGCALALEALPQVARRRRLLGSSSSGVEDSGGGASVEPGRLGWRTAGLAAPWRRHPRSEGPCRSPPAPRLPPALQARPHAPGAAAACWEEREVGVAMLARSRLAAGDARLAPLSGLTRKARAHCMLCWHSILQLAKDTIMKECMTHDNMEQLMPGPAALSCACRGGPAAARRAGAGRPACGAAAPAWRQTRGCPAPTPPRRRASGPCAAAGGGAWAAGAEGRHVVRTFRPARICSGPARSSMPPGNPPPACLAPHPSPPAPP